SSACFVTSSPGCPARCTRTEKVFGRSATRVPARSSCPARRSRSNGANRMCVDGVGAEDAIPTRAGRYSPRGMASSTTHRDFTEVFWAVSRCETDDGLIEWQGVLHGHGRVHRSDRQRRALFFGGVEGGGAERVTGDREGIDLVR